MAPHRICCLRWKKNVLPERLLKWITYRLYLGAEFPTQFVSSSIYNIVNSRMGAGKPMIINTNLTANELRERYTDRIVSRIVGTYEILTFTGSDIRQILRRQQK